MKGENMGFLSIISFIRMLFANVYWLVCAIIFLSAVAGFGVQGLILLMSPFALLFLVSIFSIITAGCSTASMNPVIKGISWFFLIFHSVFILLYIILSYATTYAAMYGTPFG